MKFSIDEYLIFLIENVSLHPIILLLCIKKHVYFIALVLFQINESTLFRLLLGNNFGSLLILFNSIRLYFSLNYVLSLLLRRQTQQFRIPHARVMLLSVKVS